MDRWAPIIIKKEEFRKQQHNLTYDWFPYAFRFPSELFYRFIDQ